MENFDFFFISDMLQYLLHVVDNVRCITELSYQLLDDFSIRIFSRPSLALLAARARVEAVVVGRTRYALRPGGEDQCTSWIIFLQLFLWDLATLATIVVYYYVSQGLVETFLLAKMEIEQKDFQDWPWRKKAKPHF